jgi:hypothetical protein
MRSIAILSTLLSSNLLAACAGDDTTTTPPTLPIITFDQAPALVMIREGVDGPWQPPTMKSPTFYEAEVSGPYVVTAVCEDPTTGRVRTQQVARVPADTTTLTLSCATAPSEPAIEHMITGHMVQAGLVQLGSSSAASDVADWDFQLSAPSGSYDLIAASAERLVVRRKLVVDGDLVVTSPIDVAAEGTALVGVAFTAPNATADETVAVSVDLATPTTPLPARLYLGPVATAKAARTADLQTADTQRVAMRATHGGALRELRRPFRIDDATEYALPEPLGGVQWTIEHGQLSTTWTALPPLDRLVMSASADGAHLTTHDLDMSPKFLAETGITHIAIDTDIPGYKPAWRIDATRAYTRELTATQQVKDAFATSSVTEAVNVPAPGERPTPRTVRVPSLR